MGAPVTTSTTCQAQAMDFGVFESIADPVPPCYEPGEVQVRGFLLCRGCADALAVFLGIAARVVRAEGGHRG